MIVPEGEIFPPPEKCPRCGKKDIAVKYLDRDGKKIPHYYCKSCSYSFIPGSEI